MRTYGREFGQTRMHGDRGAESVGLAVLFPLVLLLILTAVQGGLWWHAHSVAAQAAQAGADAGRPVGATQSTAAAAQSFADRAGRGVLAMPEVRATMTADTVQVAVSGTTVRLLPIPGLDIHVEVTAQVVKERFTTSPTGGGS
ncbi:TadE/TadG family type IV pilus assembly protein [Amycolatopsis sp. cmx-11-12]|uniref:TadE/TadG family type IV pilus assembly protein n=1 Tax=Amycolatopsis sp. cmx-11-12 TaxID=2785795 RepID=UPI0039181F37